RSRKAFGGLHLARIRVGLLQEEPLLVLAAHAGERPSPAQLEAEELELELAALDLLARGLGLHEPEAAGVPHDRRPRAVVALGDHAFEVAILERVVFDVHGQALLVRAHRGPLGYGPALQHAVDLKAQVVVEPSRRVLVHDEAAAPGGAGPTERLRGRRGDALSPIFLEVAASHAGPGLRRPRP